MVSIFLMGAETGGQDVALHFLALFVVAPQHLDVELVSGHHGAAQHAHIVEIAIVAHYLDGVVEHSDCLLVVTGFEQKLTVDVSFEAEESVEGLLDLLVLLWVLLHEV